MTYRYSYKEQWQPKNLPVIFRMYQLNLNGNNDFVYKKYWDMFEKTYDYTFSHFADREYGEWYGYLHRDGSVSHTQKGSLWKGPFHLPRCLMLCEDILTVLESNGEIHSII